MSTQPEALRLAAHAEANSNFGDMKSIAAELRRLHGVNVELLAALEKLSRLGNGDHFGNSDGNMIARAAIATAEGEQK